MHGVIAAGSAPTAEAGAEILARGGNAVDAAVAACFATSAGEPALTSLAGGGVMIHRDAATGEVTLCDFFSDAPRLLPKDVPNLDFRAVDIDFGPAKQRFHIGAGAAGVPGVIPGLCTALERWGSLPLADVIAPACRFLREGVTLGPFQVRATKLLKAILTDTAKGRAIYAPTGALLGPEDVFVLPQLADTLEDLARSDWREGYRQLTRAMLEQFSPAQGGLLTEADFDGYEVAFRTPLERRYRGVRVLTNPPPGAGGSMIALMLGLLEASEFRQLAPGSALHAKHLACAMATADEARARGLATTAFEDARARFEALLAAPSLPKAPTKSGQPSTTHVSVLDAKGNACAVTFSFGEGNGALIGDTGIMMNNLMGEADLHPGGFGTSPAGERLSTGMSPTLLLDDDGSITVLGTGGANRIRTAITQVVSFLVDRGYDAERAVAAARLHFEAGVLNAEVMDLVDRGEALAGLGAESFVRFEERNLFFGGVHLVRRAADGTLSGAGDPRRSGAFRKV
ncbi:MAG: gamma-glutamyltransferase [Deltaproteobacteria bacterium]|nr:gamma-glutamyltransferase [Deltaproteobacteria bacterium]